MSTSDWNQFKSLSSNGGDTLVATAKSSGEAYYYRFDENTRTWPVSRVKVGSSGWQNFRDVMAAPDNCRILANHTPAAPSLTQESYSRGSVMQSTAGSLEFAYTDNIGRLVHGRMADASDTGSVQWTTVSGNEAFTGTPRSPKRPTAGSSSPDTTSPVRPRSSTRPPSPAPTGLPGSIWPAR